MRIAAPILFFVALAVLPAVAGESLSHYELDNGLKVWLRPVKGAADVALGVVYDVGEDYDPAGKSGLAHLVEHLYVTSGAGETSPRTAEEMMAAYPQRWNAQTGARYTVIAFIFPVAELENEVKDAASRMAGLRLIEDEVTREQRRMAQELSNMFDGFPGLVAMNRARERVRPSPEGGRKGGDPENVMGLTLEDAKAWHDRYYKPRNARLVLAGGFDPAEGKALIEKHFGKLASGEALPAPRAAGTPRLGKVEVHAARGTPPTFPGHVCVAYPAPAPGTPSYAPFLVLVSRLFGARMRGALPDGIEANFMALDAPELLYVSGPAKKDESPTETEARIRSVVSELSAKAPSLADRTMARTQLAHLLGTVKMPDALLQASAYALAFGIARRDQMGIDGLALGEALLAVEEEPFRAMVAEVLAPERSAAVAVRARP